MRTAIDPCGHQKGAMLEVYAERIRSRALLKNQAAAAASLLRACRRAALAADPRAQLAIAEIEAVQASAKVALLATQPRDAATYEGAYRDISMEDLVFAWAEALPPGWVGVPTYHAGQRLSPQMENSLAKASSRLHFLPTDLSQGLSEPLCLAADAVVTISSTTAMAALLFGKKAAVTGISPFANWAVSKPEDLDSAPTLTSSEAASVIAFLTHRFSFDHESLMQHPRKLADHLAALASQPDPSAWMLDLRDWTPESAAQLFRFDFCFSPTSENIKGCERTRLSRSLEQQALELDSVRQEWRRAVQERDQLLHQRDEQSQAIEASRSECAALREQAVSETRAAGSLRVALQESVTEADRLKVAFEASQREVTVLMQSSENHLKFAEGIRAELDEERDALSTARAHVENLCGDLAVCRQELSLARQETDRRRAELDAERGALAASRAEVERLSAKPVESRLELSQARRECDEVSARFTALASVCDEQKGRLLEAQATASARAAELRAAVEQSVNAELQVEQLRSQLGNALAASSELEFEVQSMRAGLSSANQRLEACERSLVIVTQDRDLSLQSGRTLQSRVVAAEAARLESEQRAYENERLLREQLSRCDQASIALEEAQRRVPTLQAAVVDANAAHRKAEAALAQAEALSRLQARELTQLRHRLSGMTENFGRMAYLLRCAEQERDMMMPAAIDLNQATPIVAPE
jgi:hypothetical protein